MNDDEVFEPDLRFVCPFCQLEVLAGHDADGNPALVHTIPACEKFNLLEIDDFMHECRVLLDQKKLN